MAGDGGDGDRAGDPNPGAPGGSMAGGSMGGGSMAGGGDGMAGGGGAAGRARAGPAPPRGDPLTALGLPPRREPAWLDWYGAIPATIAQRVACDADIWRLVLDPATGLPLDVGRAHRLVPAWIRKALHARDRGCRWPRCDAPAHWTDAHHQTPWYLGGTTTIDQLISLCRWHHARVHEGRWTIHLDPTTGEITITRPDGRPYEIGPNQPWTRPTTRRGDLPDAV
jgi:hypothetical protein